MWAGIACYYQDLAQSRLSVLADTVFKVAAASVQNCPLSCGHGYGGTLFIHSGVTHLGSTCRWGHEAGLLSRG